LKLKYLIFSLALNLTFIYLFAYFNNDKKKINNPVAIKLFIDNKFSVENKAINKKTEYKNTKLNEVKEPASEKDILNNIVDENINSLAEIFISLPLIEYPRESISKAEQGLVKVNITVNNDKKIEVKLIKSSGYIRLDRSALRVAKNLKVKESIASTRLPAEFIIDFDFIL